MNRIKDFYSIAPKRTFTFGDSYQALQSGLAGRDFVFQITDENCTERTSTGEVFNNSATEIQVGDILINKRAPKEAKTVSAILIKEPVFAGTSILVLRKNKVQVELPDWAVVCTCRLHHKQWENGSMPGMNGRDINAFLDYHFDPLPEENPLGLKLVDTLEKIITLRRKQADTLEELHRAFIHRMFNNLPLKGHIKPELLTA